MKKNVRKEKYAVLSNQSIAMNPITISACDLRNEYTRAIELVTANIFLSIQGRLDGTDKLLTTAQRHPTIKIIRLSRFKWEIEIIIRNYSPMLKRVERLKNDLSHAIAILRCKQEMFKIPRIFAQQ